MAEPVFLFTDYQETRGADRQTSSYAESYPRRPYSRRILDEICGGFLWQDPEKEADCFFAACRDTHELGSPLRTRLPPPAPALRPGGVPPRSGTTAAVASAAAAAAGTAEKGSNRS